MLKFTKVKEQMRVTSIRLLISVLLRAINRSAFYCLPFDFSQAEISFEKLFWSTGKPVENTTLYSISVRSSITAPAGRLTLNNDRAHVSFMSVFIDLQT